MKKIEFWRNKENKVINPDLFSEVANEWAREIKEEGKKDKNKISQIRKFYDEVLNLSERIKYERRDFQFYLPYVRMLKAKAYYALGRKHITEKFVRFIEACINEIETKEDFEVYKEFFEAFMGFYRYYDENIKHIQQKQQLKK
ncbi:MAG TPA: type III-A CRISPR-associated protein Csm2 [Candidatus Desulfofervidus auxilii]|uniref:CRISPR system Cms protein Csm2 n=2 Tax=Thermodesulfobacteriota TaxID=200940 RepID=A0A7C0Y505_DESA2|nr:CRISPR-Cas system type III CSM-effector complex small subunit Csm2 [Candidatus Thermodesulfobacterium syntrophicum]RLG10100.1 MAG: type III-A CRISPR-associated protein Csm2 [Candidatus Pacearchaeota archaeon]HDD43809.1 type III-A CRISPR-associated protein Csm2 [Candidatus Desulfofervidus auxilii]